MVGQLTRKPDGSTAEVIDIIDNDCRYRAIFMKMCVGHSLQVCVCFLLSLCCAAIVVCTTCTLTSRRFLKKSPEVTRRVTKLAAHHRDPPSTAVLVCHSRLSFSTQIKSCVIQTVRLSVHFEGWRYNYVVKAR